MGLSSEKAKQGVPSSVRLRPFARRRRTGVAMVDPLLWRRVEDGAPCGGCGKAAREGVVGEEAEELEAAACRTASRRRRRAIIRQEKGGLGPVYAV